MLYKIKKLQIHVTHACNFTCESCSHYANQGHRGNLTPEELDRQFSLWSSRIDPLVFDLMGGEPLLNRQILEILKIARTHWRHQIRLITNGQLLSQHPGLPKVLEQFKIDLMVSRHHTHISYALQFAAIEALIRQWRREYQFHYEIWDSYSHWQKRYHGYGSQSMPFEDRDIQKSWELCPTKYCPQIFEDHIYKCPAIAYLQLQKRKWQLHEKWQPYLQYQPLSPHATQLDIKAYFGRREESICGMCPSVVRPLAKPLPFARSLSAENR